MTKLTTKMDVNPKKIQSVIKSIKFEVILVYREDAYLGPGLIQEEPDDTQQAEVLREGLGQLLRPFATIHACE